MSQILSTTQRLHQSPIQYLVSTMVQSTPDELEQLITSELEKNVTLEAVDPSEAFADENGNGTDYADDYTDGGEDPQTKAADGALSNDDRGEAVGFDHDDDDTVDTSSTPSVNRDADEDTNPVAWAESEDTFREDLKKQLGELDITKEERYLAEYIIDCLDEDGYLRRPLIELVDDLEFTQRHTTTEEDLEAVLVEIVQEELNPTGIGARNLQECLLLQLLDCKGTMAARLAYEVVKHCFDDLVQKRHDRIEQRLGISNHALLIDAMKVIHRLNPKPGNMQPATPRSQETRSQQVTPDFVVRNEEGHLVVTLCDDRVPIVRISADHEEQLNDLQQRVEKQTQSLQQKEGGASVAHSKELAENREGIKFLKERIQKGRDFIDALEQRRNTLISVMQAIVSMQRPYFLTGQAETLIPMTLQDVANQCDYDISTISRVTSSKYVDTEFGIKSLKELFTNAVADSNQTAVLEELRHIIDQEDKQNPLSDENLSAEMKKAGYPIARRTVVKYRELLGYPVARLRREL